MPLRRTLPTPTLLALPLALLLALLPGIACAPPSLVVQVAPGTVAGKPRFTLPADAGALYGLAVVPCGGGAPRWQFGTGGGLLTAIPATIVYGEVPAGFTLIAGPEPLTPGCYDVFTGGAAGRFTVRPDGSIVPDAARAPAPARTTPPPPRPASDGPA